jgi:ABC-type Fe3+-hydroxamate transport system substrate-binding protein
MLRRLSNYIRSIFYRLKGLFKDKIIVLKDDRLSDITQNALLLGQRLRLPAAKPWANKFKQRLNKLSKYKRLRQSSFLYLVWFEPLMAAGVDTYISEGLNLLGYKNVLTTKQNQQYPVINKEYLLKLKPKYLFASAEHQQDWSKIKPYLPKDVRVQFLKTDEISRPGPRVLNALESVR